MWLLIVYVLLMIAGDIADFLIGLVVEIYWPEASLPIFLFLYFAFLWLAWVAAVKITEPKPAPDSAAAG